MVMAVTHNLPDSTFQNSAMNDGPLLLKDLLRDLKKFSGIQSKLDIQKPLAAFSQQSPPLQYPNGDDCAVLPNGDTHQLFAIEGFINEFVAQDPWFAGWCGIMVNVSDIAAMGGSPTAIVNALWSSAQNLDTFEQIMAGMMAAAKAYQVPIVGGHTNLHSNQSQLSVAITGEAKNILSSFNATPQEKIVVAIDLRGAYREPYLNWNAATTAPAERLRADLQLLPFIAAKKLANAAKDISQAGILGTLLMLLESSKVGAEIHLDQIPIPDNVDMNQWLRTFPSFGFIFTCGEEQSKDLVQLFQKREISAAVCGDITSSKKLMVNSQQQRELFWNLNQTPFMSV